ncbi:MAG: hydroxymethylglutaryl-CoA lyase [Bacteroidota bacterium]
MIKLIECPRDAMQGIKPFIPTADKARYINKLLQVGFDTIDFGSFVSPKAIPQMKDTAEVLSLLDLSASQTELLAIVANKRGALAAVAFEEITYLGYPFSISETFQLRNTNASIEESLERVKQIQEICEQKSKQMVVYISMGFGNPYGDPWNSEIVHKWVDKLNEIGIKIFQLSDTIGVANPKNIEYLFSNLIEAYPQLEFGAHFHTQPHNWEEKIESAFKNGCRRFDGAIKGYGGCPMAKDDLTGNMPTEKVVHYFDDLEVDLGLDKILFNESMGMVPEIFPMH